jgi:glycosyltransferase involved in cell wall biosynthesis
MKILFYNHTGQVGGAEGLLLMILARLDRDSFDPVVICPEQGPLRKMVAEVAVPVETVAGLDARFTWRPDQFLRYLKSFLEVILQIRKRVISIKPDLIHANSIRAGLVATAATFGLGTRVVWHLHDLLPCHPLSTSIRIFALVSPRTRMIAVSQAVAENFRGRFSRLMKDRLSVILNAIDLDKFQPDQTASRTIRRELRIREGDLLLGIVGRLTPRKGQLELLRAFAQVLRETPEAALVIVGAPQFNREHEYLQLLKQTALELGIAERVRIVGARSDVAAIMQALDLLVINSTVEAFCLVALEALASGTPILAAVSGGIPELIEHGKNGWLLPRRDEQTLAAAILELSRQPELRARLAEQGRQHVNAHFSASHYMNKLQAFYQGSQGQNREAVTAPSPGLPHFAATLGKDSSR